MKKNIGKVDKTVRILLGATIIAIGAHMNNVYGILGIIPIITAQVGLCPLYTLLHISTKPKQILIKK